MSDKNSTDNTESETEHPCFWTDQRGREFASEGTHGGAIIRLGQLTAVAEHGVEAVQKADDIHHGLYAEDPDSEGQIKVNVPEFLVPLDRGEHLQLHRENDWTEVDGIPLLLPDEEVDDSETEDKPSVDGAEERTAEAVA